MSLRKDAWFLLRLANYKGAARCGYVLLRESRRIGLNPKPLTNEFLYDLARALAQALSQRREKDYSQVARRAIKRIDDRLKSPSTPVHKTNVYGIENLLLARYKIAPAIQLEQTPDSENEMSKMIRQIIEDASKP